MQRDDRHEQKVTSFPKSGTYNSGLCPWFFIRRHTWRIHPVVQLSLPCSWAARVARPFPASCFIHSPHLLLVMAEGLRVVGSTTSIIVRTKRLAGVSCARTRRPRHRLGFCLSWVFFVDFHSSYLFRLFDRRFSRRGARVSMY